MESEAEKTGRIKRIIIVEDNDNVAKLIARALTSEGYETKVITYGSAAIFYALEKKESLLLMEYQLPDMTAREVITNLRNNHQNMPFIIMSPPGNEKIIIEMMKMGARDFLVKEQGFLDLLPASVKRVVQQIETEHLLAETERSLRCSEDKFQNIFDSITDAIFIHDLQGNIQEVNQAASVLLGYDQQALLNMNILNFHPNDFVKNYNLYLAELRDNKQLLFETNYINSIGYEIPVECISKLIDYDQGRSVMTITRSIADKKKTEDLLRLSEERLQRITGTMTDYIFTVYVREGKPVKTVHSPACEKITGYTPEEFDNNPFLWIEMVDKRDRENVLEQVKQILSGKEITPYEHRIIRKDGKEAWLRNIPVLHFDESGNLISYDGVVHDITEQKTAEIGLLENRAQLNAMIKAFDGLIYVCSADYEIEYMNDLFIERTGHNPVGELCYKALHNLDDICPWCVNERVQKGEVVRWEVQSPKDNRWYSIVNTPIHHHDGRISKQAMIMDISDIKYAGQEIDRLNNLYFSLFEQLDYPVCRFAADGSLISANREFISTFSCNPEIPMKEQNLFKCIPQHLSRWTEKNLSRLDENQLMIKRILKQLKTGDFVLTDRLWVIIAILDSNNRILEYQALLRNYLKEEKKSDFMVSSS